MKHHISFKYKVLAWAAILAYVLVCYVAVLFPPLAVWLAIIAGILFIKGMFTDGMEGFGWYFAAVVCFVPLAIANF